MKPHYGLFLGTLGGASFCLVWWCVAFFQGRSGPQLETAAVAATIFATLAPVYDRAALMYAGENGPRVYWTAIGWMGLFVGPAAVEPFGLMAVCRLVVIAGVAGMCSVVFRRAGVRSVTVRALLPWFVVASVLVGAVVATSKGARIVPVLAVVNVAVAVFALHFRGRALAKLRGLDGDWLQARMHTDGSVTLDGYPPMYAPGDRTKHIAGPVLVQLGAEKAPTFRATGAPTVLRLLQGMDADLDGRRGILDQGAKAYATATVLLPASVLLAALYGRG